MKIEIQGVDLYEVSKGDLVLTHHNTTRLVIQTGRGFQLLNLKKGETTTPPYPTIKELLETFPVQTIVKNSDLKLSLV